MFDPCPTARVFHLAPGVDFAAGLVAGLLARMGDRPPEAMAKVQVFLNSARMRRRVVDLLTAQGAAFLPHLRLVTDLARDPVLADLPAPASPLRRRLELAQLIGSLLDAQPGLAPRAALYDLADSLALLMDEMGGEGVLPDTIAGLDVSDHSTHWRRTQTFLGIIAPFFEAAEGQDDSARQRLAAGRLAALWQVQPPADSIIVAGSTGSRGATALLMHAVARLPQGALVLPGFDTSLSGAVWDAMQDAMTAEDHPQYRHRCLLAALDLTPAEVSPWSEVVIPDPPRNDLISLSLRPAPVTDQWLSEGPRLPDLRGLTAQMTLIEAPSPRTEAVAIALILREAAELGTRAALVTPDRTLARQVSVALDRWGLRPDDSAGQSLALTPPGRFLRHVAALFGQRLTVDALLILLKHPLTGAGGERGNHLRLTRDLELTLRRDGPAFPDGAMLRGWAQAQDALSWAEPLIAALDGVEAAGTRPLTAHVADHLRVAESLIKGNGTDPGMLWRGAAGDAARLLMDELVREAPHGGTFTTAEYRALFEALVSAGEVREAASVHPHISILGPREARELSADLVILGGLTDGVWPRMAPPDPWLNRRMRQDAGLLLPERQIGLAAHDYQQAVGSARVVLTRSVRDAEAETVPSRWLNRLINLMQGLPERHGPEALTAMRQRGAEWLMLADALERPNSAHLADPGLAPARRPAPQPPLAARPVRLSLSNIGRLIRDPYAIYARHVLRLRPLEPLRQMADPRDRGTVFHDILQRFVKGRPDPESRGAARARLLAIAAEVLAEQVPFPAARTLWLARLERAADHFLRQDALHGGTPLVVETMGSITLDPLPFTLFGTPDRIDRLPDGRLHLIDYKTGTPPTTSEQRVFEKQLIAAAALAERGGFADLGPQEVALITYIGLGAGEKAVETWISADLMVDFWNRMQTLILQYGNRATGFASRRAMFADRIAGDYDHLARYGEWQMTDRAHLIKVGPDDPA